MLREKLKSLVRMMLRIDERDLRSKLNEHRSLIGYGSKGDGIANIVAGLFYIPTAWTFAELPMWVRCLFAVLGVVIIALGVASIVCKGLTSEKLYKEIESMNRRASSLIAVKDGMDALSNRYLTYYDEQWNCWFLPNHRSFDSYEEDKRKLSSYLSSEFKIPSDDFQMRFVGTATSTKFSTAHNEERTYVTGCILRR